MDKLYYTALRDVVCDAYETLHVRKVPRQHRTAVKSHARSLAELRRCIRDAEVLPQEEHG